jgi:hypothetical protein
VKPHALPRNRSSKYDSEVCEAFDVTSISTFTNTGTVELKLQLASDASGDYVPVMAVDGGVGGAVAGKSTVVDVTASLDTAVYAAGDVLADTQVVSNISRLIDTGAVIQSIVVIDKDDQGAAFDIYLLDSNVSVGTENAAPSITDANAAHILGRISVATVDYADLGGVRIANIFGLGIPIKPDTGTANIYVAIVNGSGTPTYTAAGIVLRFGVIQD